MGFIVGWLVKEMVMGLITEMEMAMGRGMPGDGDGNGNGNGDSQRRDVKVKMYIEMRFRMHAWSPRSGLARQLRSRLHTT